MLIISVNGLGHTFMKAVMPSSIPAVEYTSKVSMTWHPMLSVMVTIYIPAAKPVISSVAAELLQAKLYPGVPPETVRSMAPLLVPLSLVTTEPDEMGKGSDTNNVSVFEQPNVSVMITL